jgi:hypothetical protein
MKYNSMDTVVIRILMGTELQFGVLLVCAITCIQISDLGIFDPNVYAYDCTFNKNFEF